MEALPIFLIVYAAMVANSFWEAYVEGKHAWDKGKLGWKIHFKGKVILTAYHFWLFVVMYPLLLSLPLVIYGFDKILFGILISAYSSGLIIEDFFWFVVNPVFRLKDWNPEKVKWYPWVKILKFHIPLYYILNAIIALASWYFIWGQ
ncbi:MAG TPA: hypothetical protein VI564_07245 [Candidatus Nanoarchaeia archaeon]|nr:hypothetical protein [Candidatus Nanoarchaeia archaeon]